MCLVHVKASQGSGCCFSAQADGSTACKEQLPPSFPSLGPEQVQAVTEVVTSIHFHTSGFHVLQQSQTLFFLFSCCF